MKAEVREDELVPSIVSEFPSADWYEREIFETATVSSSCTWTCGAS